MKTRRLILHGLIFLMTAAIIMRFFTLQVLSYSFYKNLAENQHQAFKVLVPDRGIVYINDSKAGKSIPVASNIEKNLVYAVPQDIASVDATAVSLAKILGLTKTDILQKLTNTTKKWVPLKRELSESESQAIIEAKLSGIHLQAETYRFYPEKTLASHVLGFVGYTGDKRVGQYGVEAFYETELAGHLGSLALETDIKGRWITGALHQEKPAQDGADFTLTIDRAIQFKVEAVLKNTVDQHQADDGSVIVMDPSTGKILAMANYPSFDINNFSKVSDPGFFRNKAVSEAYEPGSVFKAVAMGIGLEYGGVTPDEEFEDKGFVNFGEFTIRNALDKVYGKKNMTQVLEESINTGMINVQQKVGREKFLEGIKKFNFGTLLELGLPAESPGDIKNLFQKSDINYATASFGQGITVTPLQLASAYSAIANQGRLMKPYIVEKINFTDGREQIAESKQLSQALSPRSASTLSAMLVSVVENGHGKRAGVPGYFIGGKTGTAQVARKDGPGYDSSHTIGTFAGFGPVENPKFVIVVKINNPKTVKFAESTAAPAFGEIASFLLNYFQITPTRAVENKQ